MRKRTHPDSSDLAARLTQWNLGVLVVLALAFGGGLWSVKQEVGELTQKVNRTNYILALALGLVQEETPSEGRQDRRAYPEARSVAAEFAAAEEDSALTGRAGTNPARSGESATQAEGKRDVSF